MGSLVQAGQDRGAARRADRGGDESVAEAQAVVGQLVDRRRLQDRVSRAAERIVTLVIDQQEQDVRSVRMRVGIGAGGGRDGPGKEKQARGEGREDVSDRHLHAGGCSGGGGGYAR